MDIDYVDVILSMSVCGIQLQVLGETSMRGGCTK